MKHRAPVALVVAGALAACSGGGGAPGAPSHEGDAAPPQSRVPQHAPHQATQSPSPASDPTPRPPATGKHDARLDGFGPLTLGMDMTAAGQAWPGVFDSLPRLAEGVCFHASPAGLAYFSLMFDDGKFVRYDASNDDLAAPGGGRRGMGEAQLQALYRNALQATPHRFVRGGKYLSLDASGVAPSRLVFETDAKGIVSEWHVGLRPHADYTEGCESDSG